MNIQMKQWILMLLSCCAFFVSCDKDDDGGTKRILEMDMDAVLFIQNAGLKTVLVTTDYDWSVSVPDEAAGWCTAERSGDELLISVKENEGVDARVAVLTLSSEGLQKTLVVKQTGISPSILFNLEDETKGAVALYDELTFEMFVTANIPYEILYDNKVSWIRNITISEADENGSSKVVLTLTKNEGEADRRTELTFKQLDGDYYACVTLTQRKDLGAQFDLLEEWFSTEAGEGSIKIGCIIPEDKIYSKIMVEYRHPRKGNQIEVFEKADIDNIVIKDLLKRDGEYAFNVSTLNEDGDPLSTEPLILRGECMAVPASVGYTEETIKLTGESFQVSCEAKDGSKVNFKNDDSYFYDKWVDGVYGPDQDTKSYVEINGLSTIKNNGNAQTGQEFYRVRIAIPANLEVKAFKFKTVQREKQQSQAPRLFDIGIGGEEKMTTTLYKGNCPNSELDAIQKENWLWSSPVLEPNLDENIQYIWFYVYDRWEFSPARTEFYFVLGEIMVLNEIPFIYDPENMTDEEMMK